MDEAAWFLGPDRRRRLFSVCARLLIALGCLLFALLVNLEVQAADASAWAGNGRSSVRLVAASSRGTLVRAGIEIGLQPGWKTYWRYPGDSGIPPKFDFAGSRNVKAVTVLWPAPQRFEDGGGGNSIGYTGGLMLPLQIVPSDPGQPVLLNLKLDYAVCEKLCVPVDAQAELMLTGEATAHDAALESAERRVPKPQPVGGGVVAIQSVIREALGSKPRIVVDVRAPGQKVDLFAEGPTAEWALPLPQPVDGAAPGMKRFAFELDGLPPGLSAAGAVIKLTAVADHDAVEVSYRLD